MEKFRFTYDGQSWTARDLKVREVEELEQVIGLPWVMWMPHADMKHLLAILGMFLRRDRSEDEVIEILDGLTLGDAVGIITTDGDDLPAEYVDGFPKAETGAPTTSG